MNNYSLKIRTSPHSERKKFQRKKCNVGTKRQVFR